MSEVGALSTDDLSRTLLVSPDLEHLAEIRKFVRALCSDVGLPSERTFDLTVAVSEAAANAIEHPQVAEEIEIRGRAFPGRLTVEVWGSGYIRRALSREGEERHRGLGLPLMASLTDELRIVGPVDGRTAVVLTVFTGTVPGTELSPPHPAPGYLVRQRLLHRVARDVLSESTSKGLLQRVVGAALEVTDSGLATAKYGYREDSFLIEAYATAADLPPCPPLGKFPVERGGVSTEILEQNRPLRLTAEELRAHPRWRGLPEGHVELDGLLGAPLVDRRGEAQGVLMVSYPKGGPYTAEDEILLAQLAGLASLGLQHVEAREEVERRIDQLMTVFEALPHAISITAEDGRVLRGNRAAKAFWGQDPAGSTLGESLSRWHMCRLDGHPLSLEELPTARALEGESVEGDLLRVDRLGEKRVVRAAAAPLLVKGKVIGAVTSWTDVTAEIRARELSDLLNAINLRINATSDFQRILALVADRAAPALGSDRVMVETIEEDHWRVAGVVGLPAGIQGLLLAPEEASLAQLIAGVRDVIVLEHLDKDDRLHSSTAVRYGMASCIAAPLVQRGEVRGVLLFGFPQSSIGVGEHEIEFVRKLANSVSLAVQNARLYEEKSRIAETLQQPLLSLVEAIEGFRVSHLYRSATEAARVGGDFFDLFNLEDGRVGVVMGDVSGHGVEAAILASLVRETIRAYAYNEPSPNRVMEMTNRALIQRASFRGFTSVFLGLIDPRDGTLEYCSAGHPPALLRRADGRVRRLEVRSPVIGALPDVAFRTGQEVLAPGDLLVAYTDGIIEARNNGSFFGEDRLLALVGDTGETEQLPQTLYREVRRFASGRLTDDLAVIAVSPRGAGDRRGRGNGGAAG